MYPCCMLIHNADMASTYYNETTNSYIDYYELEIKPLEQQVYSDLKPAKLVGYNGTSPGPTFRMERGREAVVRFINHGDKDISVHLHGSYSKSHLTSSVPRLWFTDMFKAVHRLTGGLRIPPSLANTRITVRLPPGFPGSLLADRTSLTNHRLP
jgi:hypothetical protein